MTDARADAGPGGASGPSGSPRAAAVRHRRVRGRQPTAPALSFWPLWPASWFRLGPAVRGARDPFLRTERLVLRPPRRSDYADWAQLRRRSQSHLAPWEPLWAADHLGVGAFRRRVAWTRGEIAAGRATPLFIFATDSGAGWRLVGGVTLENVRRGAAQSASLGYWLGVDATGRGYMTEALEAVIAYAFEDLDLSRLEAACLPHNFRSRQLLSRVGFLQEGVGRAYLQIDGVWRDHILYERRRRDRQGPSD